MRPQALPGTGRRRLRVTTTIRGVVITGTIGAGKTTSAEALSELMHARRVRHALIEVDWLGQVYPADAGDVPPYNFDLSMANLAAIWPNFVAKGIRYAIVTMTLENQQQLDALRVAMPGCDLTVALATASPTTIATRITARDHGRLRDDFLTRTEALAATIEQAGLHSLTFSTDDRPRDEMAKDLCERLGWLDD